VVFWVLTFIGTPCILLYNISVGFHLLDYIVSQLRRPLHCCINFKFYAKNFVVRIWYVEALYYVEVSYKLFDLRCFCEIRAYHGSKFFKTFVFWDVAMVSLWDDSCQSSGGTCCLHIQDDGRTQVSLKLYLSAKQHGITFQKSSVLEYLWIIIVLRTSTTNIVIKCNLLWVYSSWPE